MKTNTLNYKPAQIVKDYLIKVSGYFNGQYVNRLVGVRGLLGYVGVERANKMLARAYACQGDVCRCKVYGGLRISFYIQ